MTEMWLDKLRRDPIEQLRWLVARALNIAPYCQSDEEVVKCGLHLLNEREGEWGSGSFDTRRFLELKEGTHGA